MKGGGCGGTKVVRGGGAMCAVRNDPSHDAIRANGEKERAPDAPHVFLSPLLRATNFFFFNNKIM